MIDGRVNLSYLGSAGALSNQRYLMSIVLGYEPRELRSHHL
jgi:hypothetical protein